MCLVSGFIMALTGFAQMTKCSGSWLQQTTSWWRACFVLKQSNTGPCARALPPCLAESDFSTLS